MVYVFIKFLYEYSEDDEEFGIDEVTAHAIAVSKLELRNYEACKPKLRRKLSRR